MLIACCIAGDIYFFLAAALAWGGAAMHLRCHCFWRFSRPAPLLGKHIITEFVLVLFVSIKAAMDLLSIAILLQLMCLFLLPSKQSSGKSSIYGFCFRRREEGIKYSNRLRDPPLSNHYRVKLDLDGLRRARYLRITKRRTK